MSNFWSAAKVIAGDAVLSDDVIRMALSRLHAELDAAATRDNVVPLHSYKTRRVLELAITMRRASENLNRPPRHPEN